MSKLNILAILGTKREGRRSEPAFRTVIEYARKRADLEIVEADVKDFPDPIADTPHPTFHPLVEAADGFIIVTPEYNRAIPGELKMLLDTDYDAYQHKAAGLVGVSSGDYGGRHAVEQLLSTLRNLGITTFRNDVLFRQAGKIFDAQGQLTDDSYLKLIDGMLDQLIWYTRALKVARESEKAT